MCLQIWRQLRLEKCLFYRCHIQITKRRPTFSRSIKLWLGCIHHEIPCWHFNAVISNPILNKGFAFIPLKQTHQIALLFMLWIFSHTKKLFCFWPLNVIYNDDYCVKHSRAFQMQVNAKKRTRKKNTCSFANSPNAREKLLEMGLLQWRRLLNWSPQSPINWSPTFKM